MLIANNVALNLKKIQQQIHDAEIKYGRKSGSVTLLAASKTQTVETIKEAIIAGQIDFGENYLQEALKKITALAKYSLQWHFIGSIQANKTQLIAKNFCWVHSLSSLKIAKRLNEQRPDFLPPLNVCIEINISDEPSKSGICLAELSEFASRMREFSRLNFRGLMVIPKFSADKKEQLINFEKIAIAQQELITQGFKLDTLSMGMSDDFESAIAAGSTIVRIGTAIFGKRE